MTRKEAPTQRQRVERARRKAMGIALIQRPLKYIKARAKDDRYLDAVFCAERGNGALVQRIARSI